MKQGTIVNKIVVLVLFLGVAVYLGVYAWKGLVGEHVTTVVSYSYTLDDVQEATGFLVREEYVLPDRSSLAEVLPAEGEKVGVGQVVAYLYRSEEALERKREIRTLNLEREQLAYALNRSDDISDNVKLTSEIMEQITQLRTAVEDRDFTDLEEEALELKSLVYKRDYTLESGGDTAGIQTAIEVLDRKIELLTQESMRDTTAVQVDRSGVFSGLVDGYESRLTPELLTTISPSELDKLARSLSSKTDENAVGKLITNSKWYFACTLTEEQSKRLAEGWRVDVRFSRDWAGEVEMKVERISTPENGRVTVVFSSSEHLSDTTLLRRQAVDIVFSSVKGIRVPKNALYQDETGTWGVYAVVGAQAEFKRVMIVGNDDDYYLVEPMVSTTDQDRNQAKRALRPGDEIIIFAEGLYDGKVVR